MEQEIVIKYFFGKGLNEIYTKLWLKDEIDEIKFRLPSYRSFSTFTKCHF